MIALPEQLFYNTGIATYVWLLTNRKTPERQGKAQLIDASEFWTPMPRSLGDKRRQIPPERARDILEILNAGRDGDTRRIGNDDRAEAAVVSRVFPTARFGYRKITVERPLRLSFQATPERIARLEDERGFQNLAKSRKGGDAAEQEVARGRRLQESLRKLLNDLPDIVVKDRKAFEGILDEARRALKSSCPPPFGKPSSTPGERDATAAICVDKDGQPEADPELRDTERVPLAEEVNAFFAREVKPHAPDAWIDESKRDARDGAVGIVGYEINFNRYFYRYAPPRPLADIEADIQGIEADIVRMLGDVTAAASA